MTELTATLSELGLAFLLFLLGIKMRIDEIRHILSPIIKISLPQMAAVAAVGTAIAYALGFGLVEAFIIGLAVMYSSTAVVIKMLTDMGETTTLHGKIDIGILLAQDIVVVILLAVLAAGRPESAVEVGTTLALVLTLVALITVAALAASKYVLPPVFRRIADNKQVFFLIALAWAFVFVFVSDEINLFLSPLGVEAYLSIEMGAFLAGLSIAQLPYSKELQDRVNPLTDLFVMVFFVSVALTLEADELLFYWEQAVVAAIVLLVAKFVIFFLLINWQRFDNETTFFGSLYMIQVSEFGVVVGVAALQGGFVGVEILGFLTLVALITMSVSVYLFAYGDALYERSRPYLERFEPETAFTEQKREYSDHAIVVGAFAAGLAVRHDPAQYLGLFNGLESIRDFFVAIFFATVGALVVAPFIQLDTAASVEKLTLVAGLVVLALVVKPAVTALILIYRGYGPRTAVLTALSTDQVSEFALIIAIEALLLGFLTPAVFDAIVLAAAVTMIVSTVTQRYNEQIYQRLKDRGLTFGKYDRIDELSDVPEDITDHVVVLGYGQKGRRIVELLEALERPYVVIENDPARRDDLTAECSAYVFGDAMDPYTWEKANVDEATVLVSVTSSEQISQQILKQEFDVPLILRARDERTAIEYLDAGATYVAVPDLLASEQLITYLQDLFDNDLSQADLQAVGLAELNAERE